jgi:HSP20 family protein
MKTTKYKPAQLGFFNSTPFDSMFNSFFDNSDKNIAAGANHFKPKVDIVENEKAFELFLTIPGMDKKDISIEFQNDELIISGERKEFTDRKESKYHLSEIHVGKFSRKFYLPETIDTDNVSAEMSNGILNIVLPKGEKELAKLIKIK